MENIGCIHCRDDKSSFDWSGGEIHVSEKLFYGGHLRIVELLEDPWKLERYPKEQVLQCLKCNAVWHASYAFPGKPPLFVTAKIIPSSQLSDFFIEIGKRLSEVYSLPEK